MILKTPAAAVASFLALAFVGATLQAEVDKKDLEKKAPKEAKGEIDEKGETLHDNLVAEGKDNLNRIAELMEKIQDDLAKKKTGSETQQNQRNVVRKIEKLIDELLKANQSSSSSQQQQQQQQQQQKQQQQKNQQQASQQQKNQQQQEMKPGEKKQQQQQQQEKEDREKDGPTKNDQVEKGKNPPARAKKLRDVVGSGQWGLLPKKLQEELLHSSDKEFPSEYREIISKYYEKLANFESKRARRPVTEKKAPPKKDD